MVFPWKCMLNFFLPILRGELAVSFRECSPWVSPTNTTHPCSAIIRNQRPINFCLFRLQSDSGWSTQWVKRLNFRVHWNVPLTCITRRWKLLLWGILRHSNGPLAWKLPPCISAIDLIKCILGVADECYYFHALKSCLQQRSSDVIWQCQHLGHHTLILVSQMEAKPSTTSWVTRD